MSQLRKVTSVMGMVIGVCAGASQIADAKFDGSVPLLCVPIEISECEAGRFRATAPAPSTKNPQGGLFEGVKTREQRNREEQVRQDWEAKMAVYSRIVGVCMEERGYTVL